MAGRARAIAAGRRDGRPVAVPDHVQDLIVRYHEQDKLGYLAIANRLTADGVPTPSGRSTTWAASSVRGILARIKRERGNGG